MGFRLWLGGKFDYPQERHALMQLLQEAIARWGDEPEPYALFVDFQVGLARPDLVAITDRALVVIDLKEAGTPAGVVRGGLNGDWGLGFPDGTGFTLNKGRDKNPYQQLNQYRWQFIEWLHERGPQIWGPQAWSNIDPLRVGGWVVIAPDVDQEATDRELAEVYERNWWFRVVGLAGLCDRLFETRQHDLFLGEAQIAAMAEALGLTEVRSFGGFLWPGEEALPVTPLFSPVPLVRRSVDRDGALREAVEALTGPSPVTVLVITGAEGSGKSHIARLIAQALAERGRRCLWADCGRAARSEVTVETLLLALANEMPPGMRRQTVADRYVPLPHRMRTALEWCDQEGLVLILDDYGELAKGHAIGGYVRQLDACCPRAQVVVTTSRKPDFLSEPTSPLDGALTIEIGGLDVSHVAPFLEMRSVADNLHLRMSGVDASAIRAKTGGLPVLLNILAQLSRHRAPDEVAESLLSHEQAREWIDRMLRTVSEDGRRLAAAASVVRHGLDRDLLLALADSSKGPALIEELVDGNALTAADEDRFVLTAGLREYYAEKTPPETRRKAHERAMKHLAQRAAHRGPGWVAYLEEATYHALEAEKPHPALEHAGATVEELRRLGEHRQRAAGLRDGGRRRAPPERPQAGGALASGAGRRAAAGWQADRSGAVVFGGARRRRESGDRRRRAGIPRPGIDRSRPVGFRCGARALSASAGAVPDADGQERRSKPAGAGGGRGISGRQRRGGNPAVSEQLRRSRERLRTAGRPGAPALRLHARREVRGQPPGRAGAPRPGPGVHGPGRRSRTNRRDPRAVGGSPCAAGKL